jgi:hypothetical protein
MESPRGKEPLFSRRASSSIYSFRCSSLSSTPPASKTIGPTEKVYTGLDSDGTALSDTSAPGEVTYSFWARGSIGDYVVKEDSERIYTSYGFAYNGTEYFVVDPEASISNGGVSASYVACFTPVSVNDTDVLNNLKFFHPRDAFYPTALNEALGLTQYPDVSQTPHTLAVDDVLSLQVSTIGIDATAGRPLREQFLNRQTHTVKATAASVNSIVKFGSNTLFIYAYQYYPSFRGRRCKNACSGLCHVSDVGSAKASRRFFPLTSQQSLVRWWPLVAKSTRRAPRSAGRRTFFFMGGFLSLNLAIFNLLPFPGLDGWQLACHHPRGAGFKKKVSEKVKNTVSFVGLALLFVFAIAITIKDIVALV